MSLSNNWARNRRFRVAFLKPSRSKVTAAGNLSAGQVGETLALGFAETEEFSASIRLICLIHSPTWKLTARRSNEFLGQSEHGRVSTPARYIYLVLCGAVHILPVSSTALLFRLPFRGNCNGQRPLKSYRSGMSAPCRMGRSAHSLSCAPTGSLGRAKPKAINLARKSKARRNIGR